jgi:hypothetical protein
MVIFVLFQKPMEVDVQKNRFALTRLGIASALVGLLAALGVAVAESPAQAVETGCSGCNASELQGCETSGYTTVGNYPLNGPAGNARNDIGYIQVLKRPSPSDPSKTRWCILTWHGSVTWKYNVYTYEKIGSRDQGSTSNPITWYYSDGGNFSTVAGGVALTPGTGRCPTFYGRIDWNGTTYSRTLNGGFACN